MPGTKAPGGPLRDPWGGCKQIILRWLTQRRVVAIPKSVRTERIVENLNVFDVELSPEEMAAIATLDTRTSSFFDHRDPKMMKALGEAKRPT